MKFRFERQASEAIKITWGHGRYLDPWSVVHVCTGFLLGTLGLWLTLLLWQTLLVVAILAALYEGFELLLGIIEDWQNSLCDIVLALFGAWGAFFFLSDAATTTRLIAFAVVGVFALALLNVGYWYYLRRRMGRK